MRRLALLSAAAVTALSGCNVLHLVAHNLANEPIQYLDERKLGRRLRSEAEAVWKEVCQQFPEKSFSADFAAGFVDGYADYLEHGGVPRPPAVPPLHYRRSKYLTPEGQALVRDYLTGFKYGADVAAGTGRREFLTVPVVLPDPAPEQPLNLIDRPPEAGVEPLPPPRPAPDGPPVPVPPAAKPATSAVPIPDRELAGLREKIRERTASPPR